MKINDLLYEVMEDINDVEADMMAKDLGQDSDKSCIERQETLTLNKIHKDIKSSKPTKKSTRFSRKKMLLLVAAAVMLFSMVVYARENDWDIEFAQRVGLSGAMQALEGGYVEIGVSDSHDDITVTAVRSIGDQNRQWIQFDTNIPWEVGEKGYYMFDDYETTFSFFLGDSKDASSSFYSYNNDGNVSFLLQADVKKINRAKVDISLGQLYVCEDYDNQDETVISDATWNFQWKNYYAANTISVHPYRNIDGMVIHTIEISPISIRVEVIGASKNMDDIEVECITMDDGTEISCENVSGGSSSAGVTFEAHDLFETDEIIDLDRIKSVTVEGEVIEIK